MREEGRPLGLPFFCAGRAKHCLGSQPPSRYEAMASSRATRMGV
jgi:hypothetical protein